VHVDLAELGFARILAVYLEIEVLTSFLQPSTPKLQGTGNSDQVKAFRQRMVIIMIVSKGIDGEKCSGRRSAQSGLEKNYRVNGLQSVGQSQQVRFAAFEERAWISHSQQWTSPRL
jgi:hypothetical protein